MADQFALEIILLDLSEHATGLFSAFTPRAVAVVALRLLWRRVEIADEVELTDLLLSVREGCLEDRPIETNELLHRQLSGGLTFGVRTQGRVAQVERHDQVLLEQDEHVLLANLVVEDYRVPERLA